jgi:hypothetical protein
MDRTARLRPDSRRARAAVLWFTSAFVLAQLAGGAIVDRCPVDIRFPEGAEVLARAEALPRRPDVLLLGSSRLRAVPARQLHALIRRDRHEDALVFNASVPAGNGVAFDYLFAELAARGRTPRICIVEVAPEMIMRGNRWVMADIMRLLTWRDVVRYAGDFANGHSFNEILASRAAPIYRHRQQLWTWIERAVSGPAQASGLDATPPDDETVEAIPAPPAAPPELVVRPLEQEPLDFDRYTVGGIASDRLLALLERCRRLRVQVVLVAPPASAVQRQLYSPAVERAFDAHLTILEREYGAVRVDLRARLADTAFSDRVHLTHAGALATAELLVLEGLRPAPVTNLGQH